MKEIFLNDILNLSEEEISDAKIAFNIKWESKLFFDTWNDSDSENREVSYSYYSHYGKQKNFTHIGQMVFGFVQLPRNNKRWLLVTAGRIKSLPDHANCQHEEIERFKGLHGRMIVEFAKGNKNGRYVFNLSKFINEIKVVEILPNEYQAISFKGLDNVHLKYRDLKLIINGEKYADYRNALVSVKGVYCLTDTKDGKLYIGSAYGEHGVAQRWENYINTNTGGNVALVELYQKKGEKYFQENFTFTLIEFFAIHTDDKTIINREAYWKKALSSRECGYNKN